MIRCCSASSSAPRPWSPSRACPPRPGSSCCWTDCWLHCWSGTFDRDHCVVPRESEDQSCHRSQSEAASLCCRLAENWAQNCSSLIQKLLTSLGTRCTEIEVDYSCCSCVDDFLHSLLCCCSSKHWTIHWSVDCSWWLLLLLLLNVVFVEGCLVEDNWLSVKYCAAYIPNPAWSAPLFHWRWGMPGSLSPAQLSSPRLTDVWNTQTSLLSICHLRAEMDTGGESMLCIYPLLLEDWSEFLLSGWTQIPVCCDYVHFCRNPMVSCELFMIVAWNLNELWWYYIKEGW